MKMSYSYITTYSINWIFFTEIIPVEIHRNIPIRLLSLLRGSHRQVGCRLKPNCRWYYFKTTTQSWRGEDVSKQPPFIRRVGLTTLACMAYWPLLLIYQTCH